MGTCSFLRSFLRTVGTGKGGGVVIAVEQSVGMITTTHRSLSLGALFEWHFSTNRRSLKIMRGPALCPYPTSSAIVCRKRSASCALVSGAGRRVHGSASSAAISGVAHLAGSERTQLGRRTAPSFAPDSWYAARKRFASMVHLDIVDRPYAQSLGTSKLVSGCSVQLTAATPIAPRQTLPLHVASL
jgi:hypothetical protein